MSQDAPDGPWADRLDPGETLLWSGRPKPAWPGLPAVLAVSGLLIGLDIWIQSRPPYERPGSFVTILALGLVANSIKTSYLPSRSRLAVTDRRVLIARRQLTGGLRLSSWPITAQTRPRLHDGKLRWARPMRGARFAQLSTVEEAHKVITSVTKADPWGLRRPEDAPKGAAGHG
ncbi:MAG: hypothetical protein AAGD12_00520 [Pseudomonadota bacterium]